jgi:hypothetical protein
LRTPCQLRSLVGQEHGRTIPLAVIDAINIRVPDITEVGGRT